MYSHLTWLSLLALPFISIIEAALFTQDDFANNVYLDTSEVVQLLWTQLNDTYIEFGVICKNPGWCAIGVSSTGTMKESDIAFFWIDDNDSTVYLQDRYASTRSVPTLDDNQDALTLIAGSQENDTTYIHFVRKIYPCEEDRSVHISIGSSRIIYAYNENDPTDVNFDSTDNVEWHGYNQMGVKSVNLLTATANANADLDYDSLSYYDLRMPNNTIPDDDHTTYYCGITKLPVYDSTRHIVALEPLIVEGNEGFVHHMIMYHCPASKVNDSHVGFGMNCDDFAEMPNAFADCADASPIYGWAIGGEIFEMPDDVAFEMSGDLTDENTIQYIVLEIHYDNPSYTSDVVDYSGMRVWYTDDLRNTTASGFWVGLNVWEYMHFIPAGLDSMTNTAYCDASCLGIALEDYPDGVNIFSSFLHAHTHGISLKVSIIRDNEEITIIDNNENYDFDYQTTAYINEPIKLLPTDIIYSECTYDTSNDDSTVFAGESTSEEMCLVWLNVYPKIELKNCLNQWDFDNGYLTWLGLGVNSGYIDENTYLWTATADNSDAISYYKTLWDDTSFVDRSLICSSGDISNFTFYDDIDDVNGWGIWPFDVPTDVDWYEYPDYCNWTEYSTTVIPGDDDDSAYIINNIKCSLIAIVIAWFNF